MHRDRDAKKLLQKGYLKDHHQSDLSSLWISWLDSKDIAIKSLLLYLL